MAREGELTYFSRIGEDGRQHAIRKPFTDPECPETFADLSFCFSKLPRPPARILECGCGTGWLSYFLAKRGYSVTGQDVSEEALELARSNPPFAETGDVEFICSDFEGLDLDNEYDAVIFYSSLHHAEDELGAIRSAYKALKPGGVLLTIEPGKGHEENSQHVIEEYDVGDRDMPPSLQIRRGKKVGFSEFEIFVHPVHIYKMFYGSGPEKPLKKLLWRIPGVRILALALLSAWYKRNNGAVLMRK